MCGTAEDVQYSGGFAIWTCNTFSMMEGVQYRSGSSSVWRKHIINRGDWDVVKHFFHDPVAQSSVEE